MLHRIRRFLREHASAYLRHPDKKPLPIQIRELLQLYRYYGYLPYQYFKHDLYSRSFTADILDYVPAELVHRFRDARNPAPVRKSVDDKIAFFQRLQAQGVLAVPCLFQIHRSGWIKDLAGNDVSAAAFFDALRASGRPFFLKPVSGGSGQGAWRLAPGPDGTLIMTGKEVPAADFWTVLFQDPRFNRYLVQPDVLQHPDLARINPRSVNTVRIDTLVMQDGVISSSAFLRAGTGGAITDNTFTGGLVVPLDLASGELQESAIASGAEGRRRLSRHPDSGAVFGGTVVPFWCELLQLVAKAAVAMDPLGHLGWDVVVTSEGPLVLEANHDFSATGLQDAAGGLRRTPLGQALLAELAAARGVEVEKLTEAG